jgi:hypothetical protein
MELNEDRSRMNTLGDEGITEKKTVGGGFQVEDT